MTGRRVTDLASLKYDVDSGDLILLGPEGKPALVTMKRDGRGHYRVKSGDGRQAFVCKTWGEAGESLLKIIGTIP